MNEINFLPPSFMQQRRRRLRLWREFILFAVVLGAIAVWYGAAHRREFALQRYIATLQSQMDVKHEQGLEIMRMQAEFERLTDRMQLQRKLAEPVPLTAVLATLTRTLPSTVALTELSVEGPDPLAVDIDPQNARRLGSSTPRLRLSFEALAPDDAVVADAVSRLSEHPLFSNVKLIYGRRAESREVVGRAFRLEFDVLLDREYLPAVRDSEVADAS